MCFFSYNSKVLSTSFLDLLDNDMNIMSEPKVLIKNSEIISVNLEVRSDSEVSFQKYEVGLLTVKYEVGLLTVKYEVGLLTVNSEV